MANQRLNATIQIGGTVARSLTRGLSNTQGQLGEVGDAIQQAKRRQTMLSREIGKMGRQGMNVEPLRRQYEELGDEIDTLRRKQGRLQRAADADVGGRFNQMTTDIGNLARRTGVAIGGMGAAIGFVTHTTANSSEELNQYAKRLGVTTEWLSRTQYAAEQFGITNDAVVDGIKELSLRADEFAKTGKGPAAEAFERLGLSREEINRLSKDTAQLFEVVKGRMTSLQDSASRQRVSDELLGGEAGEQFIEYLQLSREEIGKLHRESDAVGRTMTEGQEKASREYMRSWRRVSGVVIGLRNTIGTALMPVIGDMMGQFSKWAIDNRATVEAFADSLAQGLRDAIPVIGGILDGMAATARVVGSTASVLADLVGGFDNLTMVVGGLFAGKAIASVVSFGMSVWQAGSALLSLTGVLPMVAGGIKAIGTALMANPVGLIIGAIAGAGYLIYHNWESVGPWFASMWEGIKDAAEWAWDGLKSIFGWTPLVLIIQNWGAVTGWLGDVWQGIKADAGAAWDWLEARLSWSPVATIAGAWSGVTDWLGDVWQGIKTDAGAAWDWLEARLSWSPVATIAGAWSGVTGWLGDVWQGIKTDAGAAWDWLEARLSWSPVATIAGAWSGVTGWLGDVWQGIKTDAGGAWDWLEAKLSWSPLETIASAWGGVSGWFAGLWDGITASAERAMDWITRKLEWVGNAFGKVRDWLGFGDDEEAPDTPPPRLSAGHGPGPAARVGAGRRDAEARGQAAIDGVMPRPEFSDTEPPGGSAGKREGLREVTQQITNHLTLHVTRRDSEGDASYAERIAEMVMEQINERQQGALYDG